MGFSFAKIDLGLDISDDISEEEEEASYQDDVSPGPESKSKSFFNA